MENELPFENWFDIFIDKCNSLGYSGPMDRDSFLEDYEKGTPPEETATTFVTEMTQP